MHEYVVQFEDFGDMGRSHDPRKADNLETGKGEEILPSFQKKSSPTDALRAQLDPNSQNCKPINCVILSCLICSDSLKH